jgi:hypothetical protein
MTSRTFDNPLPFLLLHPAADTNPACRDKITCDDPLPAIVETTRTCFGRETRMTEVKQETLDDQ